MILRISRFLGFAAILTSVLCNEFILSALFASGEHTGTVNTYIIRILQVLVFLWGFLLLIFAKRNNKITAVLYGILVAILLIAITEIVCYIIYKATDPDIHESLAGLYEPDPVTGYKYTPDAHVRAVRTIDDEVIYNVEYNIDSLGRREVPLENPLDTVREKFIAFFGCSVAFGAGLNDNQTLPWYIQKSLQDHKIYNYGVMGYGAQQVYAKIRQVSLAEEIREKEGICIYEFIDEHIDRTVGTMEVYNLWAQDCPYYYLNDNMIRRNGTFTTGRPLRSVVYAILGKSYLLKLLKFNLSCKYNSYDLALTAGLIKGSDSLFRRHYKQSRFIVLFYPGTEYVDEMIPYLEYYGIEYLDYSSFFELTGKYKIPGDYHPTEEASKTIAVQLCKDLYPD